MDHTLMVGGLSTPELVGLADGKPLLPQRVRRPVHLTVINFEASIRIVS
jgi:hypothetical protein